MAALVRTRNYQFRFRSARTSDMPLKTINIINKLDRRLPHGHAANPATKRYSKTAMPTLLGANLQQIRFNHTVKTNPIVPINSVK